MEKIKKVGKSQYGPYVQLEDNSFKSITEPVHKFLEGKAPCEIEIEERTGSGKEEKISKVKILTSLDTTQPANSVRQEQIDKAGRLKLASMCISYAKDLAMEGKLPIEDIDSKAAVFFKTAQALADGDGVEASPIQTSINSEGELK